MMKTTTKIEIAEVIRHIEHLVQARRTGSLFVTTAKGMIAQIVFVEGHIINIRHLRVRGVDAVQRIFEPQYVRELTFLEKPKAKVLAQKDLKLPPQSELLAIMRRMGKSTAVVSPPVNAKKINIANAVQRITDEFAKHIGPMATLICQERFENVKTLGDITAGVEDIAKMIDNGVESAEFKRRVQAKLQDAA